MTTQVKTMRIDWKYWLFLLVFLLSQAMIALSLQVKINAETQMIIGTLSGQIACHFNDEYCETP
jgi:uncharacterized transporter YbjL